MAYMETTVTFTNFPATASVNQLTDTDAPHVIMPLALWQHLLPTLDANQRSIIEHASLVTGQRLYHVTLS